MITESTGIKVTLDEYRLALKVAENAEANNVPGAAKVRAVIEEKIEEAEKCQSS